MGNKAYNQLLSQLTGYLQNNFAQQQAAAAQESPYLTAIGKDATSFLDTVRGGDLRKLKTGSFWNMDSLADRNRQRDLMSNAHATGQAALGSGANPTLLALDKQNRADEAARDYGSEFQDAVINQTNNANNAMFQLGTAEQNRRTGVANNSSGLMTSAFQAIANKPKGGFLSSLLSGGLSALPGVISALGDGGTMEPGGKYRIGSENVKMNADGTAKVTPSKNPIARHLQKMAERVDMVPA